MVIGALGLAGCDLFDGNPEVAGDYLATELAITTDGQTTDLPARGALLELEIDPLDDGDAFRGPLVLPDVAGAVDETFGGTYTIDERGQSGRAPALDALVTFDTAAGSFVSGTVWEPRGDRLSTPYPVGGRSEGLGITLVRG